MRTPQSTTGDIELDLGRYELRRLGRRVKLEKKPMELLIFLVGRRDQLVSRREIVAKLWRSDLFIDTERNINNLMRKLRTALHDDSAKPRFLETVVGKGYRFIGPVRVIDPRYPHSDFPGAAAVPVSEESTNTWNHHCSLAVLPLFLLGNATDERGLCLGFADALVSHLGNLPGVDVLPASAVLNVPPDATGSDLASRLGVRFVVRGAIQTSKGQSRLSVEMFDSYLASVCWKRTCHLDLNRLTELEIDMAKQIAAALHRPLRPSVSQRRTRYSNDPLAYSEFMHGYRLSSSGDPTLLDEAAAHLTNAVAILLFRWHTPRFRLSGLRGTSNTIRRGPGWRRRNFTVGARLRWIRICRKDTLRMLFCCGGRRKTSSIWKPSPSCGARWRYRRICLMPTIVWAQSWLTLASSIMLVRCMSADDPSILKKL